MILGLRQNSHTLTWFNRFLLKATNGWSIKQMNLPEGFWFLLVI